MQNPYSNPTFHPINSDPAIDTLKTQVVATSTIPAAKFSPEKSFRPLFQGKQGRQTTRPVPESSLIICLLHSGKISFVSAFTKNVTGAPLVQIEISCRHGSIGDAVQAHIREKSEKLLTYFERVTQVAVTFDFNNQRVRAEILVDAEHRHDFVAHHEGEDAQRSFDQALHKVEQQIKKYKEQIQDHRRDVPVSQLTAAPEQPESEETATEE